jgi:DNA-binding transcriptional MocR family regulator
MERIAFDSYVIDVLMPDLVGHDRRPAAFVVYLYLLRQSGRRREGTISVSLQSIATKTGLSKSSVQGAIRHLKRRGLLDPAVKATVTNPVRRVLRPWTAG